MCGGVVLVISGDGCGSVSEGDQMKFTHLDSRPDDLVWVSYRQCENFAG